MDENKIKELYEAEINDSAPDFEKLWEKIDGSLTEKQPSPQKISITPKKSPMKAVKAIAALAAGLALVAFIPSLFSTGGVHLEDAAPSEEPSFEAENDAVADSVPSEDSVMMEEAAEEDYVPSWQPKSYEELKFDSYAETIYTPTGEPYGGEYFVEDEILAETDCFVLAVVKDVSLSDDESSLIYTLDVEGSYGEKGENISKIEYVESCSVYTMKRGREYLLPLVKTEGGYRTAYDGVPQIEFTSDGGMIYYNGWTSLDGKYSNSIEYPQASPDAFFYDRMMLSGGGFADLIERFEELKEL